MCAIEVYSASIGDTFSTKAMATCINFIELASNYYIIIFIQIIFWVFFLISYPAPARRMFQDLSNLDCIT